MEMMEFIGHKVYALQIGHHGIYEGVVHQTETIWPAHVDTVETRVEYLWQKCFKKHLAYFRKNTEEKTTKLGYTIFWFAGPSPRSEFRDLYFSIHAEIEQRIRDEGYKVSYHGLNEEWPNLEIRL